MNMTARQQRGMEQALAKADDAVDQWPQRALAAIEHYPRAEFIIDELRDWAYQQGLPHPPSEQSWGGVIRRAKNSGLIRCVRTRDTRITRRQAPVWRKQI